MPENERTKNLKVVGKPVRKKDSMELLSGTARYTADIAPRECLVIRMLRSPHANAMITDIDTARALKAPGIVAVFTYQDVDQNGKRYTQAGQTPPEPSPMDRLVLDRHVRFVGDPVALVVGRTERACERALPLIRVQYEVLPAVLDMDIALDNPTVIHPEENWEEVPGIGGDRMRNLVSHEESGSGDIDAVLSSCDVVIDRTYRTQACQQAMMETFRSYAEIDAFGRLVITASTQIVFHTRRIVANALHIPEAMIRVRKPRIGGGFGAKQTAVSAVYPAFVTWKLKKPSMIVFSRVESQTASSPRHPMELHVKLGAMKDGTIRGIALHTLSDTGAYGEHGPTTIGLSGHKSIPLYGSAEAFRFTGDCVYTNHMSSGAYRGYGATQGIFAVESAVNELADTLHLDPLAIREKNQVREGMVMPAYFGETAGSCALDRCLESVRRRIDWDENFPVKELGDGKCLAYGIAMAMQGSGISAVDQGSATIKLSDGGFFNLIVGSADMGTGSNTTLSQIAAEVLDVDLARVQCFDADTDISPYDSGSYASSTAYVTGGAVEKAARKLREKILAYGAELLHCDPEEIFYDGTILKSPEGESITLSDLSFRAQCGDVGALEVTASNSSKISPPPFMAGAVELFVDRRTGETKVQRFVAAVDCGTSLDPALTRVQAEGGILQGIGMALTESVTYDEKGQLAENSFLQYKIPTRQDIGRIDVELVPSYEKTGPFGAKSIGEVVINTPQPAIADALYHATGKRFTRLPVTPEDIAMACLETGRV